MLTLNPTVFLVDPGATAQASLEAVIRRAGLTSETLGFARMLIRRASLPVPSCLLLDIGRADLEGIDLLRRLAAERKEMPIIAIAMQSDIPMIIMAMKAGVAEILIKPVTDEALLRALRCALVRSQALLDQMAKLRELRNRYDSLSGREREVMTQVVAGKLNKRIGAALGISENTVKAHRHNVMRKMRSESLAELVAMALALELPAAPTWTSAAASPVQASYRMTRITSLEAPLGHSVAAAR